MRFRSYVILFLALLCTPLLAGNAAAQGATTGTIRGQVVAAEGGTPVVGATVTAVNAATGFRRSATAGDDGRYTLPLLPPGTYRVEARGLGYGLATRPAVVVRANESETLEFRLAAEAVAIEGLTATAQRATVDVTQGGVVQTVTTEQVENLPTQGRDFTDFLNLSPLVSPQPQVGTGGQFSIGGARSSGTNVQIDGADANNQFFGENRGSSRTPFAFSLESIREFQLITNGFDVEYGNYQGGVVNAITRGGTNEFRATGFGFFRDQALTADDFNGQPASDYTVQQFGLSVSGPVIRDRLHFFASVDAQNKEQPVYALTPEVVRIEADTVAKIVDILNSMGFPNAESLVGTKPQAEDNLVLFGRVDWTINDNHRFTIRGNYSDFEQTNDRLSTFGDEMLSRGGPFVNTSWSTVAELNSVFGRAFNTLRVQYSDEDRPRDPNTPGGYLPELRIERVPAYRFDDAGNKVATTTNVFGGGDGVLFRNRLLEDKVQLVDNFTIGFGDHTFKVGTNNILSSTENMFYLSGNGQYRFGSFADFAAGNPNRYQRNVRACPSALQNNANNQPVICPDPDVPVATFDALEWSLYAQDEWQATPRLLVTPGIRWGGTSFRDEPGEVTALESAFGVETGVSPDLTGISPRLAFTYDLGGEDLPSVLRGGVGLLVGRVPNVLVGNVFQTERPLLFISCSGGTIPTFNLPELLAGARGENNPAACASGAAPTGRPEYAIFDDDFELPRTLKANVGYERVLPTGTRVGVDLIYSRTEQNFNVFDVNLRPQQFTLGIEGRPVFVPEADFNPVFTAGSDRLANAAFDRVYLNASEAEARSVSVALELDQNVGEALQVAARYAYTKADDNSSFSCCTSFEGFSVPTAGNPNFLGGPGDGEAGAWGPSDFERRHTFVLNAMWDAPLGIRVSGIWRSTSGTPWTPLVDGDVNGDGLENDRAYVGTDILFDTPEDAARFDELVGEHECLADQLGQVAERNSCRNPWFHSVDLRLSREFRTFGRQRAELIVDAFNVLNGLNEDWGRFMGVFGSSRNLLVAEGYDAASDRVRYSVNDNFGSEAPVGFDPFQFQLQLGIRYRY